MQIVGADPEGSVYSGGTGRPYLVEGVGEDFWPTAYDPDGRRRDRRRQRRRLLRDDPPPGPRGGPARRRLVRHGRRRRAAGRRATSAEDDVVVVLLPGQRPRLPLQDLQRRLDGRLRLPPPGRRARPSATCCARKSGELPALVHTHPNETIRDAIDILREYGVSQMPVVKAEPPVMSGEVAGSVSERDLLELAVHRQGPPGRLRRVGHGRACRSSAAGSRSPPRATSWRMRTPSSSSRTASRPASSPARTCSASSRTEHPPSPPGSPLGSPVEAAVAGASVELVVVAAGVGALAVEAVELLELLPARLLGPAARGRARGGGGRRR